MLTRTLSLSVIAVVAFALFLVGMYSSALADDTKFTFDPGNGRILGQSETHKKGTWLDRVKNSWNRLFQDETPDRHNHGTSGVVPQAVPTQPPKPVTASEIQQSATSTNQGPQRSIASTASSTLPPRSGSQISSSRENFDEGDDDTDTPVHLMLRNMRKQVYDLSYDSIEEAARTSRQRSNSPPPTTLVPLPPAFDLESSPREFTGEFNGLREQPSASKPSVIIDERAEFVAPSNRHVMSRSDQIVSEPMIDHVVHSPQYQQPVVATEADQQYAPRGRRVTVSTSPRLEFQIEDPQSVAVNQEVTHRIRVTNTGDAPAEGVVVNTEIPSWIDIQHVDANSGGVVLRPREDGSGTADLEWKIHRIDQSAGALLVLRSIPRVHRAIEFPIRYDYKRPAIIARVEVQEPRLEMQLLGADEVRWDGTAVYTLLVHNAGNGSAENVRLDLLQTSSEACFCEIAEPLLPGQTQEMNIEVQPRGEQEYIDIAIVATGAHDLKGDIKRRVRVLRPKLEMSIQTLPLHFVDSPAELTIRMRNAGTADADKVDIRAELPLGALYKTSSEGGIFTIQQQQNVVEWRGKSVARNETQTFTLVCSPQREGDCRVSVEASEANGNVLAACNGTFRAEAVVELDLIVNKPSGPIELGQEIVYEIQVMNTGTKAAENVEISMTFGPQLEPMGAGGGIEAYGTDDGQVFFEKIPAILPKQCVTVKVVVKAEKTGTAQIKAEVARADVSGTPIRTEKGLSAYIVSRRGIATASGQSDEISR